MTSQMRFCGMLATLAMATMGCEAVDTANMDGSFSGLYDGYFKKCGDCHAPGNPANQEDIETTLDFSSAAKAHATLTTGSAAGLASPYDGCNGVPFVAQSDPGKSLILAVLDEDTRKTIDLGGKDCGADTISDMTLKTDEPPAGFISALKTWISGGAAND